MMSFIVDNGKADWALIDSALRNPKWDFRTAEGIAEETGLPIERVEELLADNDDKVRRSYVKDKKGRVLFTFKEKEVGARELVANTIAFLSKSPS